VDDTVPAGPAAEPASVSVTPSAPDGLRITPALAFAAVGAVLAAYILQRVFVLAHRTIGWVVACSVVALVIDPVVTWTSRRLPRGVAIISTIIALVVVAVAVVARLVSELTSSAKALAQAAPVAAGRLEERSSVARNLRVTETIKSFTKELTSDINQEALSRVKAAPTYLVTGILMLFILAHGRRYLNGALAQISDANRQARVRGIVRVGVTRGRNRLLLSILQVVVVTLIGLVVFEAIRLRASFILAFLIGLASLMPFVGMVIAAIPAGIMAYGLHGVSAVAVVVVVVLALQILDLLWWRPRCNRRTLEIGLFLPLVATMVGYRLYNVGGAIYGYALVVVGLAVLAAANLDGDGDQSTWGGENSLG
jgi:putative heme transporter